MTQPTNAPPSQEGAEWLQGPACAEVPDQTTYLLDYGADGIVIINLNGRLTAFRNACLHQEQPLHAGYLDPDGVLLCPWHNWCYNVATGECLTAPGAYLEQYALHVEDGRIWIKSK